MWSEPQTFLAVLRLGSVSGAAREMGLAQATVRRRIEALEARLGAPLFARGPGGLTPTPTAARLGELAGGVEEMAGRWLQGAAVRTARPVEGAVRVSAVEVFAVERLAPFLAEMRAEQPGINLVLRAKNHVEDLLRGEADIALRMVRPTQNALVARLAGATEIGLFAHRDFLARHGEPSDLADLRRFAVVGPATEVTPLRRLRDIGFDIPRREMVFRSDSMVTLLAALDAGMGVGPGLACVMVNHPNLVRVLPRVAAPIEVWAAMHEDQRTAPAVRLVFDALCRFLQRRDLDQAWGPASVNGR